MSEELKCANLNCNEIGKLKCSACASVYYCSSQCQKAHWSTHKTNCKQLKAANANKVPTPIPAVTPVVTTTSASPVTSPVPTATTTIPNVDSELLAQFQALKSEIQKLFNTRDFVNAVKKSEEAIELAKQFPSQFALPETIQIQINLSTAFLHMNKLKEAESYASASVLSAEINSSQRPGYPQAIEILTVALGCKAVAVLSVGRIEDAYEAAQRALSLAESIYPKNDPRLHKSLRTLGLIQDKKGDLIDAERTIFRAYTIICIAGGPACSEAQLMVDDLVNMFSRKKDLDNAEKYARMNYKAIVDKKVNLQEREGILLADSASRLASVLVKKGELEQAEKLVAEALEIRDTPQFLAMNPIGVAYSLSQYVGVCEELGKLGSEGDNSLETMLTRAIEIFSRIRGPQSQEVVNSFQQLRRIRQKKQDGNTVAGNNNNGSISTSSSSSILTSSSSGKKKSSTANKGSDDDEDDENDDDLQYTVTSESKGAGGNPLKRQANTDQANTITPEELARINSIPPHDGIARMQLANFFFEQHKFHIADILIEQALTIFEQTLGDEHENTKAARQNLQAVRHSRLNQLWLQVVTEEILSLQESTSSDGNQNSSANKGDNDDENDGEYSRLMKGNTNNGNSSSSTTGSSSISFGSNPNLSLEEQLFLSSLNESGGQTKQNSCVVC